MKPGAKLSNFMEAGGGGEWERRRAGNVPVSFLVLACLLGAGMLTTSCGTLPKESATAQPERVDGATNVDVAVARTGTLQPQAEYTGTTAPVRSVSMRSQVEGQLLALSVDIGDTVKRGQTLVQVDDALLRNAVQQAEAELATRQSEVARANTLVSNARADLERARLELQQAQADAQRLQQLLKQGAVTAQAAQQAQTQANTATQALRAATEQVRTEQQVVAAAKGRVVAQQAVIAEANKRRAYTRLTSPINGVVLERSRELNDLVRPGEEILKLGDFSRVQVSVQVSEKELGNIRIGQAVQVRLDAFPNQTFNGQVARISPVADGTARLVPVEVVIPNSGARIGSGLLARVSFATETQARVVVPQTAIQEARGSRASTPKAGGGNRNSTVFVVTSESQPRVQARAVTLGENRDGRVEILSGLQAGERFVVRSGKPLKDGDAVRLSVLSDLTPNASPTSRGG